jgi:membrane fusion protein, copper/silver efflux system
MSDTPSHPLPARKRFGAAALVGALVLGLVLGGGGVLLERRHVHEGAQGPSAAVAEQKPKYVCPMHPNVASDHPGDCPICGMKLILATASTAGAKAESKATAAAKATYVCPMHPSVTSDHPGDCPICGMKLVKAEPGVEQPKGDPGTQSAAVEGLVTVNIDPQRQQLIGLRTAEVTHGAVGATWRTVGKVAVDETRVHHVSIKVGGFAEQVYVDYVGKLVRRGEPLFTIYSPDLLSVQQEYLRALRTRKALAGSGAASVHGDDLVEAARERLRLWDIPEAEIQRLERTGKASKTLTIQSPMSGVVTRKDVVMGHRLNDGDMPYDITDLSSIWVLADAYESDLSRIKLGMTATLSLQAFANRTFKGRVIFIDPLLDARTRTAKVRLEFPNPTGELRPEMFGEVTMQAKERQGLRIPGDAVIDSGTKKVVFVALPEGKFQPREVRLGAVAGETVEVLSGLSKGDRVVTRANFLVDSESRLRASLAAMGGKEP